MDYSLLRPFDLQAAKAGERIVIREAGNLVERTFVTGPDDHGYFVVKTSDGWFRFGKDTDYRMAPLAWVEGKPVYKGDKMWRKDGQWTYGHEIVGKTKQEDIALGVLLQVTEQGTTWSENLTWNPPKVKREGWIAIKLTTKPGANYSAFCSHVLSSKAKAESHYGSEKVAVVLVEWEE